MKKTIFFLSFILLQVLIAEKPQTPGTHKRVPCEKNTKWSFDLYLPKAYATKTKKKFPVLYITGSGAFSGFRGLEH